jgi:hypothetical protein
LKLAPPSGVEYFMRPFWIFLLLAGSTPWAGAQESALRNPSFELTASERAGEPETWMIFTESGEVGSSRLNLDIAQHGSRSMCLAYDWDRDHYFGITQEVPVQPGQKLILSGYFRNFGLKGKAHARLGFEWKNKENREIGRFQSNKITAVDLSDTDWKRFELSGSSPPKADHVTVTITVFIEDTTEGGILIDSFELVTAK